MKVDTEEVQVTIITFIEWHADNGSNFLAVGFSMSDDWPFIQATKREPLLLRKTTEWGLI